jgi:hypothetical protein
MKKLSVVLPLVVLALWLPASAGRRGAHMQAQSPRARIDVSTLGPQVGQQVPDFRLPDQSGRARDLASVMGPRGAMLVFVRSADW